MYAQIWVTPNGVPGFLGHDTKGDVILADWSRYLLVSKGGIRRAASIHVYFDTDEVAFRWTWRINGEPADLAPATQYKGSTTTSPFVLLDTRS